MAEEEALKYTADLNLSDPNDPHVLAVGRVPAGSDVLDLGTADGSVARVLQAMGCGVWGVELDAEAAARAKNVCREVVLADLNELDFSVAFGGRTFDIVLMLDVLEHLVQPVEVLRRAASVLKPSGWAVISLPNVAHISVRLALLRGHFDYTDVGLLDRTHLRFFDADGVQRLLEEAGWKSVELLRVVRELGTTEIPASASDHEVARQYLGNLEVDDDALTYQFVVTAAPAGSTVLSDPPVLPAAIAQRALLEFQTWTRIPGLWNELESIREASLIRREHLRHLVMSLQENSMRLTSSLGDITK